MKHFVSSAALVAAITEALLKLTPSSSLFSSQCSFQKLLFTNYGLTTGIRRSLGLRDNVETIVQRIKGNRLWFSCIAIITEFISDTYPTGHSVTKEQLLEVVAPALGTNWPGDEDVKRAFRVFDSEGLGFIKVTLLKRFLVQSQLGVDDAICKFCSTLCI